MQKRRESSEIIYDIKVETPEVLASELLKVLDDCWEKGISNVNINYDGEVKVLTRDHYTFE